jgi:hypothetical protein
VLNYKSIEIQTIESKLKILFIFVEKNIDERASFGDENTYICYE